MGESMLKKSLAAILLLSQFSVFAEEKKPIEMGVVEKNWENPHDVISSSQVRPMVDSVKSSLNIASDEEVAEILKTAQPALYKKIADLNIDLTDEKKEKLQKIFLDNKASVLKTYLTGELDPELDKKIGEVLPQTKNLDKKTKNEIAKASGSIANKLLIEKMIEADATMGVLLGNTTSTGVAELNAKLLNLRKITIGNIEIDDVHMRVELGFPKNGLALVSGKIKEKGSKYSADITLGSFSKDLAKHVSEFNLAQARVNYNILPWLSTYGALKLGVRSYEDGTVGAFDPTVGVEVSRDFGAVKGKAYIEGTYRIAEANTVLNCGGILGMNLIDNDYLELNSALISRMTIESNPRAFGNESEMFTGVGFSGSF
jgi:hypothetical protein